MNSLHLASRQTPSIQYISSICTSSQRRSYSSAFTACPRWQHQIVSQASRPRLSRSSITSNYPRPRRRNFSSTTIQRHAHLDPPKPGEERHVTFIDKEGERHTFEVADGDNLLDIAQANDLEMEGACGGSCACSTCHIILSSEESYNSLEEPSDDENDMLDLAFGLTETSRLGCQVKMSKEIDGLEVRLPSMTRNMQASDFGGKNEGHG